MFCYGETCCVQSAPELKELSGEEWNALKGRRTGLTEHHPMYWGNWGGLEYCKLCAFFFTEHVDRVLRVCV